MTKPYRGTTLHSLRIPDEIWRPAVRIAHARGESVTEVVTARLAEYVARHAADDPGPASAVD